MINIKQTLNNWHKEYPDFDVDTLLGLLDGITENYYDDSKCYYYTSTYGNDYDIDKQQLA